MLYGWIKSLVIYLIFSGIIINLAPSGNYKKYIRLFTGIIAIIILIKPISYIFNYDNKEIMNLMKGIESFRDYNIDSESYEEIYDYYDMGVSESIRLKLEGQGYHVQEVSILTDIDNNILSCGIYIEDSTGVDGKIVENNIKNYISQVYNLQIDSIYIVRR